jgi:energy-converting hydrogenase Eha subunit G
MNKIVNRMTESTPKFFRLLRNIGLVLAAASATTLAAGDILPAIVIKVAGYVAVAGSVITAVSQAAVKNEQE